MINKKMYVCVASMVDLGVFWQPGSWNLFYFVICIIVCLLFGPNKYLLLLPTVPSFVPIHCLAAYWVVYACLQVVNIPTPGQLIQVRMMAWLGVITGGLKATAAIFEAVEVMSTEAYLYVFNLLTGNWRRQPLQPDTASVGRRRHDLCK